MSSTAPGNLETLKEKILDTKLKMASFKAEFASMKSAIISKMGWNGSVMKDVLSQKDSLADRNNHGFDAIKKAQENLEKTVMSMNAVIYMLNVKVVELEARSAVAERRLAKIKEIFGSACTTILR